MQRKHKNKSHLQRNNKAFIRRIYAMSRKFYLYIKVCSKLSIMMVVTRFPYSRCQSFRTEYITGFTSIPEQDTYGCQRTKSPPIMTKNASNLIAFLYFSSASIARPLRVSWILLQQAVFKEWVPPLYDLAPSCFGFLNYEFHGSLSICNL